MTMIHPESPAVIEHPMWCEAMVQRADGSNHTETLVANGRYQCRAAAHQDGEHHGRSLHVNGDGFGFEVVLRLSQYYDVHEDGEQQESYPVVQVTTYNHEGVVDPCTATLTLPQAQHLLDGLQSLLQDASL